MIQLIREYDCRVAGVIEHRAMSAHHPIGDFLAVNVQWRSRFAVGKRRHYGGWAQQHIPLFKKVLPGGNRLVADVQGLQVVRKPGRSFLLFRLESSHHHAYQCPGTRQFLLEIHRWQRRFFNDRAQGSKSSCELFSCLAHLRRDRKAWKGGSKGDPQALKFA